MGLTVSRLRVNQAIHTGRYAVVVHRASPNCIRTSRPHEGVLAGATEFLGASVRRERNSTTLHSA
jgi:hypothetical protein